MKFPPRLFDAEPRPSNARPDLFGDRVPTFDSDGRRWPKPLDIPRDRVGELERTIATLSEEITQRCTQVADLCNIRQQQEGELLNSCDEIDRLTETIEVLQNKLILYERDATVSNQGFAQLVRENDDLRLQIESISQDALRENQQYHNELNQLNENFGRKMKLVEETLIERKKQIEHLEESRAILINRVDTLTKIANAYELDKNRSREEFIAHAVETLETLLMVERKSAESKIRELTEELRRERLKSSTTKCASVPAAENKIIPFSKPTTHYHNQNLSQEIVPITTQKHR